MRAKLPLWAWMIVSLVIFSFFGFVACVVGSVSAIQKMACDASDPKQQKTVADKVADFPHPLPPGFSIDKAIELSLPLLFSSSKEILIVKHLPDNLSIQMFCDPQADPSDVLDAANFLDRAIELSGDGLPAAKIQAVKSKGQAKVKGHEMAYIVGEFKDPQDRILQGMIGCICVKDKHKTILIYAAEPPQTVFDLETVMTLFNSAKSF